jgi:hypothetical protein
MGGHNTQSRLGGNLRATLGEQPMRAGMGLIVQRADPAPMVVVSDDPGEHDQRTHWQAREPPAQIGLVDGLPVTSARRSSIS